MATKRFAIQSPLTTDFMGLNTTNASGSDNTIKYHLVEAEEVNHYKPPIQSLTIRCAKPFRKSKFNWSHYDAMEREETFETNKQFETKNPLHWQRYGKKNPAFHDNRDPLGHNTGQRVERRGRREEDQHGYFYNGVYIPTPDFKVTAQWAKSQIEFYFTSDNLVRDIFLRQHMDVDGYVPLAFVGSFQAVYSIHQDYPSLFDAMKDSETLELDQANEKIRLRHEWKKWIWPNATGGYGVPRYIKQTTENIKTT
ncbi:unnamed protein product [Peronospora belbahrii]|uniref:HTH La-type RNA-binding domain-containing protein n=1 Tax=Peronospora belbahrii TaxID=622444 RepID=A0AAU9KLZ8_9STRA|nr:unnamed protein product [Peronospora belbahrii]CAH0515636.1 unnamed protein product [Peronospora belbahrii]